MKPGNREISQRSIELVRHQLTRAGVSPRGSSADRRVHLEWHTPAGKWIRIQVKGNAEPKPAGGKGKLALYWWVREDAPADVIALVDLSTERTWLLTLGEVERLAQQHSSGRHHLYMYTDLSAAARVGNHDTDFHEHLLDRKVDRLFQRT